LAKKKETLIDEAKRIKEELAELKRKKEIQKTFRKKTTKPTKKKVKHAKVKTRKKMRREKMMKLDSKNIYLNSKIYEIVNNNHTIHVDKNSASSSNSEIVRCMILHALRNSFGIENLKSGIQEYEKEFRVKETSKIPITLNNRMFLMVSVFKNNFEFKSRKTITTSQILNSLIYFAHQNNFNYTVIPEYTDILKSYNKTENALRKKRKTIDETDQNMIEDNSKEIISTDDHDVKSNVNYARLIEYNPNDEIENSRNKEIQELEERQDTLREILVKLDSELNNLKISEEKIRNEIIHEENFIEKREGHGISKIFKKFSKKDKPLDEYSKKFLKTKSDELIQNEINSKNKLDEIKKTDVEIRVIEAEIKKIHELDVEIEKLEEKIVDESGLDREEEETEEEETEEEETEEEETEEEETEEEETEEEETEEEETEEENSTKGGVCKRICNQFKAKRPSNGKRYDSGQARCQICEQWIDYHGAHMKNNIPATEFSVGWYCNCCNYRVRQKPRNKVYKEKLADDVAAKKVIFESLNQNPCSKCGIKPTADNIESIFGMRVSGGKSIRQSYCRECRNSHTKNENEKKNRERITQKEIEGFVNFKNLINPQPYTSVLQKFVVLANQFPNESIKDIFEKRYSIGIKSQNTVKNQKSIIMHFNDFLESKSEQPISTGTKTSQLNKLKSKYPYYDSKFDKFRDRTDIQYHLLVSTKNLKVAEFVLRWEHNHKQRIAKKTASEILTDPETFLVKNEFAKEDFDEIKLDQIFANDMEMKVLKYILDNEPVNPHLIAKSFPKVNLPLLEREEKVQWDKNGSGWVVTQKIKEKFN